MIDNGQAAEAERGGSKTQSKRKKKASKKVKAPKMSMAEKADKFVLYQKSVQAPEVDSEFLINYYKKLNKRFPKVFREDFCGTFTLSCHVAALRRDIEVLAVDLDGPTLDWGRENNLAKLKLQQQKRVQIFQEDVLNVAKPKADMIAALNFSYQIFKTRELMTRYFKNCIKSLNPGGVLFLDLWGGSETQVEQEEATEHTGFTYVWDQFKFDPLTYHSTCKIHFDFPDGSRMEDAFIYHWRLWTIPELREILEGVGFEDVHILWEGTDSKTNEGNGEFERVEEGEADDAWIAYLIGRKKAD